MPHATITYLPADNPVYLFHQYNGETDAQPAYLQIDLEDGELTCDWNGEIGSSLPEPVYHGRVRRYGIPLLPTRYANQLLDEAKPIADRILADASIEWDGNNRVGVLRGASVAAENDLITLIARYDRDSDDPSMQIYVLNAADWFINGQQDAIAGTGITADTTDEQLAELAARVEKEAIDNVGQPTVVTGIVGYLTDVREDLREKRRDRLSEVAEQIAELTTERNHLIRQLHGWKTKKDSLRGIAALADLTHTGVDKIIKSGPMVDPDDTFIIQRHLADGTWDTTESFGSDVHAALAHCDARNAAEPDPNRQYRVVDRDGVVYSHSTSW